MRGVQREGISMPAYKLLLIWLLAGCGCFPVLAASADTYHWAGYYDYFQSSDDGLQQWEYSLHIYPDGDELLAKVMIDGHMTFSHLLCRVEVSGNLARFIYLGHGQFNDRHDAPGDLLFSLERTRHGLLTHWQSLVPLALPSPRSGAYDEHYFSRYRGRDTHWYVNRFADF